MKTIEILNKGNPCYRLTVTPTMITIKNKVDASNEEMEMVRCFLMLVAHELKDVTQTYRGALSNDLTMISMRTDSANDIKIYHINDFFNE